MGEGAFYPRTWPQRLADTSPCFGMLLTLCGALWLSDLDSSVPFAGIVIANVILTAIGVEHAAHYRGQRDTYRRSLVALVRKVNEDQVPAYYEALVPADVLAEAIPSSPEEGK